MKMILVTYDELCLTISDDDRSISKDSGELDLLFTCRVVNGAEKHRELFKWT